MKLTKKARKALDESIVHWQKNFDILIEAVFGENEQKIKRIENHQLLITTKKGDLIDVVDFGSSTCSLCKVYLDVQIDCKNCPLCKFYNKECSDNFSAYDLFSKAVRKFAKSNNNETRCNLSYSAENMLNALKLIKREAK